MKLRRLPSNEPDFPVLYDMLAAMRELLEGNQDAELSIAELLAFQDDDGSFKLMDSYRLPSDARVDFCHVPTSIGAAILMKAYVSGEKQYIAALERALKTYLQGGFSGHGYEAEEGCMAALRTFIKGGLRQFLETEPFVCPEFHTKVHNILHQYNSLLLHKDTRGAWRQDYRADWEEICAELKLSKRLYLAYGSNMDQLQMAGRCQGAEVVGRTYLKGWELTMPWVANIEPCQGKKTPGLVWEITGENESALDRYEGYPFCYDKINVTVNVAGSAVSAMAYVMTDKHKRKTQIPNQHYVQRILAGYCAAGFDKSEFQPRYAGAN